ncbi:ATP-binding protein [Sphingomonas glacialis]|uniref:histidine kinase n=1 Tax=Sphingomonas glacialis TaxID=658225 RepID=A0A502G164_9SPHN|nr:ATP-binding protein [Sphingomonas glacialis]TPG55270.1 HAMP domain-containing protein [Sphingomonas glacialis]
MSPTPDRPTALVRARAFVGSMAGRIFLILAIGMSAASIGSLFVAEQARQRDFKHVRLERVALSTVDVVKRLQDSPEVFGKLLAERRIFGAIPAPATIAVSPNPELSGILRQRLGAAARPEAGQVPSQTCLPRRSTDIGRLAAGIADLPEPDCWVIRFVDRAGVSHSLAILLPALILPRSSTLDPAYLSIVFGASALLAMIVARLAAAPLRRLAEAARAVSIASEPEPVAERGPTEVQAALRSFNVMQQRVRDGVRDRTQLLAAISHDLQTPLTRLRLRLEQVSDDALRERLTADLVATQTLVREGLELARSSESREPLSSVDIDSLLSSIAEDASEFGSDVTFVGGCGAVARVKPNALTRTIVNLVENAVKHGGSAQIECFKTPGKVTIAIRDFGSGIPESRIEAMFAPFERGDASRSRSTGGTGLGLTIARAQAKTFGAEVFLSNHPAGGLLAAVVLAG